MALAITKSQEVTIVEKIDGTWHDAHATFYGDVTGRATMRKYRHIGSLLLYSIAYILCLSWCMLYFYMISMLNSFISFSNKRKTPSEIYYFPFRKKIIN